MRIQHDTDTFCELIEERLVRRAEALERSQFHDRLDLSFEDNRQNEMLFGFASPRPEVIWM